MSDTQELWEMRLKRFLHYGTEQATYKAGDRHDPKNNYYKIENVPSLMKIINGDQPGSALKIILKVKAEETSLWPDSITFALAVCATQNVNANLQSAAYKALRDVCKTARDLFLFVKFYREIKKKTGGGNGYKKAIAQWYLVWTPFDLADILLHQRSFFGVSHQDVLRTGHIKAVSLEHQVLLTYAARGLEVVKKKFAEEPNEQVKELIDYLSSVEEFRKIKDPQEAAKAIALELHNLERVPSHLLKSQDIWNELIPNMDVKSLLDNFQRLSIQGFLKSNNPTVLKVADVFNNLYKAESFKGHPTRVYIELMAYERAAKYSLDFATKLGHPLSKITPARKPPKPNLVIKSALTTFFYSLFKFQVPTGLKYLVAVDVRPKMFSDRCHYYQYMSPIEAAALVTLSLVRTEPEGNVVVGTFHDVKGDLEIVDFDKESEIAKYEATFTEKSASPGPAPVTSAIHWAETNKKTIDMFVILSNYCVCTTGTRAALNKYRETMKLPNTKIVTCSLSGKIRSRKDVEGQHMLCVVGFDEHTCRLIECYARGAF